MLAIANIEKRINKENINDLSLIFLWITLNQRLHQRVFYVGVKGPDYMLIDTLKMVYNTRSHRATLMKNALTNIGLVGRRFDDLDWYELAFVDRELGAEDPLFKVIDGDIAAIHVFGRIADRIKMAANGVLYCSRSPTPDDFRYGDKMAIVQDFEWPAEYPMFEGEGSFAEHVLTYNMIYSFYYMLSTFWDEFVSIHGSQHKFHDSGEENVLYKALFRINECAVHLSAFVREARYDSKFDALALRALDF